jgi:hypothetical protein
LSFLVEDLLESVKSRSFVPISQTTFQDVDLLRILNEEMTLKLVADISNAREDFFLTETSVPIVQGKDHYLIPSRAIGNAIKAVFYVDPSGNKRILPRRDVDRRQEISSSAEGAAEIFYFQADEIVVQPVPRQALGSLLFNYPRKPNTLVLTSACAKISAQPTSLAGSTTFTVDTDLTATVQVGSTVDFLRGSSPYALWAESVTVTAIDATTIAVATSAVTDVDGVTVEPGLNDYVCLTGTANIPMLPEEFHPVLAQMGTVRVLASLGHTEKWQAAKAELQEMRKEALKLISNRAQSAPEMMSRISPLIRAFRGY